LRLFKVISASWNMTAKCHVVCREHNECLLVQHEVSEDNMNPATSLLCVLITISYGKDMECP